MEVAMPTATKPTHSETRPPKRMREKNVASEGVGSHQVGGGRRLEQDVDVDEFRIEWGDPRGENRAQRHQADDESAKDEQGVTSPRRRAFERLAFHRSLPCPVRMRGSAGRSLHRQAGCRERQHCAEHEAAMMSG